MPCRLLIDEYADLADVHGGPAVIETFGEKPFSPVSKPESWAFTEAQQKLQLELDNESGSNHKSLYQR